MELMLMHYLLLSVVWATLTFQIYLDENADGQQQTSELGLPGLPYDLTWAAGDTSSIMHGTTDAAGYITTAGTGTLTLETACATYTAQVDEVSGQAVIPLACSPQRVYPPQIHGTALEAKI